MQLKNDSILVQGDSVVFAYLPQNMDTYPTYDAYHQEPVCVDMIGEIRFNLERIEVPSREMDALKFNEAKRMCALRDSAGKTDGMEALAKSIGDKKSVLIVYDQGVSSNQTVFMKVMDGMYNVFIAPLSFMNSLKDGYPRSFSSFTKESVILTSRYELFIFKNGQKKSQHESKLVRKGDPSSMTSFGKDEITHVHLKEYFDEYK